jgi:HD-GYP domain-containing protein (c-di-GMP phosphodiesterase class II)
VRAANEPAPLACTPEELDDIAHRQFDGPDGKPTPYLAPEELVYLQIPHGTLDATERYEIQSHVEQTYQFLLQIPWTDNLKNLARYAYGHHEKLDGSGYPLGLKGEEIPVQTRLMTIADIFDALTASDRPYKRAVAPDVALDIIQGEARAGQLDVDLVRVLVESQVYRQILAMNEHGREL